MNLSYSILWFDDDKNFFDSVPKEPIEETIASWGFLTKIVPVHSADEFNQYAPFDKFDMIVVDYKIGDDRGDTFIKSVRDQRVYTEVIFYSTSESSELWEAIRIKQLEGVFVTNKRGIEQKVIRVAEQSVRKVLDLENMRGIVMSEVGDLDLLLEDIFVSAMNGISQEQQDRVFTLFHKDISKQAEKRLETLIAFKNAPSIEMLLELCDSNKRWKNFHLVKKHHELLKTKDLGGDYVADILMPRNCLAHGIPEKDAEGGLLFSFNGNEFPFNDDTSRDLRNKIIKYKSAFAEIADSLK
jgi:hypothetical protein